MPNYTQEQLNEVADALKLYNRVMECYWFFAYYLETDAYPKSYRAKIVLENINKYRNKVPGQIQEVIEIITSPNIAQLEKICTTIVDSKAIMEKLSKGI
ncbi:hypothetical protein J4225_03465 [Candidatus Pacearchaeota archaeon]|nr:hypothetical protein [Candidatus Pacearchaeota archaeon]